MAEPDAAVCPLCGEPVAPGARRCENCGADISESPEDRATDATTLYLCPSCGSFVSSADVRCTHCGADLAEEGTPPAPPVDSEELFETIPGLCPNCGSVAPGGADTCAVCGASLHAEPPTPPRPSPTPGEPPETSVAAAKSAGATARASAPLAPRRAAGMSAAVSFPAKPAPRPAPRAEPRFVPAAGILGETFTSRLAIYRDLAAVVAFLALPAVAVADVTEAAGHEWGQLFTFGVLLGIGIALTIPEVQRLFRPWFIGAALLAGLILLVTAPVLGYGGVGSAGLEALVLAAGLALLAVVAWRLRRSLGPSLTSTAGLLLLTTLAISPFVFSLSGPSAVGALWILGGVLALGGAGLILLRRWLGSLASTRLARADAAYGRREYEKAIATYEAAIALGRRAGFEVPAGWYGKGAALVAADRIEEAVTALDRAIALAPENEVAWINKGTALSRLGRMNDALKCYNAALKVNPAYEVAWNNKGNALARLGKPDLALACYERALEIDEKYRTAWVNKGFVLAKLGRFEEAAACADAALRLTSGAAASA